MLPSLLDQYQDRIEDGILRRDPVQEEAAEALQDLLDSIIEEQNKPQKSWFERARNFGRNNGDDDGAPKGIYIHGGVGRGKSMLMDMFFEHLPDGLPKRRVHFHEFMIELHDYIHSRRSEDSIREGVDEAVPMFSERIAEKAKVLCFDEFHVTDVADAMLLGRLFTALFGRGVIVIATSNWPPQDLYKDGLKREYFLPFIDLLQSRLTVFHLNSETDYRRECLIETGTYFHPLNDESKQQLDKLFQELTKGIAEDMAEEPQEIQVKGRTIPVPAAAAGVARFTFAGLCENPLGAEDYIEIAARYHTVFVEDIPILETPHRNEAKRLMTLIDVLYENGTNLAISAMAAPDKIYTGSDHGFEFERTISRLLEMQSAAYLSHSNG